MSNETKHTPGPWSLFLDGDKFSIKNEENEYIASTYCVTGDDGGYTEEANARLIAAAPEMLESLKALVQHLEYREDFMIEDAEEGEENDYTRAKALITKAENLN